MRHNARASHAFYLNIKGVSVARANHKKSLSKSSQTIILSACSPCLVDVTMIVKRRGISELISTIIIILVVSIAGSLLFTYSSELFQRQQDKALLENSLSTNQAQERFKIIAVWWNGNDDLLNITVYNYGTQDLEISDIYIDSVRVQTYFFGRNELILSEKYLRIAFTSPVTPVVGETYSFNIVSSNGVKKVASWEA